MSSRSGPRLSIVHGARAAEAHVLARLDDVIAPQPQGAQDWSALTQPVRVVVPSASLRQHLSAIVVRPPRRAVLGLQIQTHHALALELLQRAGQPLRPIDDLLPLVVRRLARQQPSLARHLDELDDAYATVATSVRDLLDAGFEPIHADAVNELLDSSPGMGPGARARAGAVVAVASELLALLEQGTGEGIRLDTGATLLRRATAVLDAKGATALPTRALIVHGFADATGVVTDFIESLLRSFDGELVLDQPPLPGSTTDFETAFPARFTLRMSQLASPTPIETSAVLDTDITVAPAHDPHTELRLVAQRIRALVEAGVASESIGVVARDVNAFQAAVRSVFHDAGLPFSGVGTKGPSDPGVLPVSGLRALLRHGGMLPLERWLDLVERPASDASILRPEEDPLPRNAEWRDEIRRRLFARGASVLRDVVALSPPRPSSPADEHAFERRVIAVGRHLLDALDSDRPQTMVQWGAWLRTLANEQLSWSRDHSAFRHLDRALDSFESTVPPTWLLDRDELITLLDGWLAKNAHVPLGGRGGGVQVLDATEARGRTFEHLFVVGLDRDLFPRPVHEDPLLSDALRESLRQLLPDLSAKRLGFDEERYLFAHLLTAAPRVNVSWHDQDSHGRSRSPSPLLDPLVTNDPPTVTASIPAFTVDDHLHATALAGDRASFGQQLVVGFRHAGTGARRVARARMATLAEIDPDRATPEGRARGRQLGPFLGLIGAADHEDDPRRLPPAITTLEQLAACPWQTFVQRLLRIRASHDPLASLPGFSPRLVGDVVHQVLERRTRWSHGANQPPWPTDAELADWLDEAAQHGLARHGLALQGLARATAQRALPFVKAARDAEPGALPNDARAEVAAQIEVLDPEQVERVVRLRADRRETVGPRWRLTDYKTGRPPSDATSPSARRAALVQGISQGTWLQVAAYLRLTVEMGESALGHAPLVEGRYVFLRPDLDPAQRVWAVASQDPAVRDAFDGVMARLFEAWDAGTFFPRLVAPDQDLEPRRCRRCPVAIACVRRDSSARKRLGAWAASQGKEDRPREVSTASPSKPHASEPRASKAGVTKVDHAARAVWSLPLQGDGTP